MQNIYTGPERFFLSTRPACVGSGPSAISSVRSAGPLVGRQKWTEAHSQAPIRPHLQLMQKPLQLGFLNELGFWAPELQDLRRTDHCYIQIY
jgi:hypothetical protein